MVAELALQVATLGKDYKARTILIKAIDVVDLSTRIEALLLVREQTERCLVLLLTTGHGRQARLLVDDDEVFILIEDLDTLMGELLRERRWMYIHFVSGLKRGVELGRSL